MDVANLLADLAEIEQDRGRVTAAGALIAEAAAILDEVAVEHEGLDDDVTRVWLRTLELPAGLKLAAGQLAAAITDLERAVELAEGRFGPETAETAQLLVALGVTLKMSGHPERALDPYRRAAPVLERVYGQRSLQVSAVWHNVAGAHHALGEYPQALGPAKLAWDVSTDLLGADDPRAVADEVVYATVLDGLGRASESLPLYEHALRIVESRCGRDHPEVAAVLHNQGAALADVGRVAQAETAYRRAISIRDTLPGQDAAVTRSNLGRLLLDDGRGEEALTVLDEAVRDLPSGHWIMPIVSRHRDEAVRLLRPASAESD